MTRVAEQENYRQYMPFARQPLKGIYVAQRMFTTLVMVLWWAFYYTIMPRKYRPRPSWSLRQIICVNFTRRIYKVTELAGVTWGTRNPEETCDSKTLKETHFEWVGPLPEELRAGVIAGSEAEYKRVGVFVWPRDAPEVVKHDPKSSDAAFSEAEAGDVPLVGIFMHGGGYCHMSAHENAPTSKIPRRFIKDKAFTKIYAVEYRLLQHAPFPAQVQDAAAVYYHIVEQHQHHGGNLSGRSDDSSRTQVAKDDGVLRMDYLNAGYAPQDVQDRVANGEARARVAQAAQNTRCKIVLIGDSAGGNLVLALARWIRDEARLPPPDGLLLLSPSCDPSHAFPESPSSYIPRPHADTDYLVDTPEPRALLQRTFLGNHPLEMMHSPYVSPASQKVLRAFYGDAFAESIEDLTIARMNSMNRAHLRDMASAPSTPVPCTPSEGLPGPVPMELGRSPTSLDRPIIASPRGLSLFSDFPRACVVLGDAERLEREATKLVGAMERDGVDVKTVWVKDGAHDVLMMGWWDENVRTLVYNDIETWLKSI
ncbi:alpha/beta-hydrolase [Daedalea quercina L-15889]|uniref:Alpha/beta-hydrolase n=1 Tax=Daedalea quercina L-15889 TaxID=1314783 RepID=A0A165SFY0_9APHY|nr:alpha/beta-hydrolase [Daedalea quercina L-15889]